MTAPQQELVVVCALEFEREQFARAGLRDVAELTCCGPGSAGVTRWVQTHADDDRLVVLAGLAGGLSARVQVGGAYSVTAVRSAQGEIFTPTLDITRAQLPGATVSCPQQSLTSPTAKRDWHAAHGTDLIDLESEVFARALHGSRRPWAIVRGVSDGVDDSLPASIDSWVDANGRVRRAAVALALARKPGMLAAVNRLGANSKRALAAVGAALRAIAEPR